MTGSTHPKRPRADSAPGNHGTFSQGAPPALDPWLWSSVAADVALASRAGPEGLEARRARRLQRLLSAAARHSPLCERMLRGRDLSRLRLQDLPVMRKGELMRDFDRWVADPCLRLAALRRFVGDGRRIADAFHGRYVVWESSGSSGEPGIFVQDALAMAVNDALEAWRRPLLRPLQRMLDPWWLGERVAFVGAIDGHFASTVSIERLRRLNPLLAGRLRSVSFLWPVERIVAALEDFAPTVLATYPSAAMLLARERRAGRLRLPVREVWTGGEDLSQAERRFIGDAFGCQVANSYGASEFLSLAFQCGHGHLHLNSDWAILECVDAQGRPVPPGQPGATTLLTNLANHVQPLIRYDLGDRVVVHACACTCGSCLPVIEVHGRSDDTLRLRGRAHRTVDVLPLALSTVLEEQAGLYDFQLVQQGPGDLLLSTGLQGVEGDEALHRARRALGDFLRSQGAEGIRIDCRSGEAARALRSGKVPRVVAAPCR